MDDFDKHVKKTVHDCNVRLRARGLSGFNEADWCSSRGREPWIHCQVSVEGVARGRQEWRDRFYRERLYFSER